MTKDISKYNKLCIETDLSKLQEIREYVVSCSINFGFDDSDAQNIALAVDEACTNLIKYSFNFDTTKQICISIETKKNEFTVLISDNGSSFNPLNVTAPNMNEYFRKMKPGGLGILIMRSVMDDISYKPSTDKTHQNTLRLKKILA